MTAKKIKIKNYIHVYVCVGVFIIVCVCVRVCVACVSHLWYFIFVDGFAFIALLAPGRSIHPLHSFELELLPLSL